MNPTFIMGVTGGSGSGKTTIVRKISETLSDFVLVPQDNYYRSAEYMNNQNITAFNFDHPSAFDTELLVDHISRLKRGLSVEMPQYDFVRNRRLETTTTVKPGRLVVLEGIMIFFSKELRDLIDLKIYVDTPDDIRFIRRLRRDLVERGRTLDSVITQYLEVVRPGHYDFIEPTRAYADLIVPEGGNNEVALEVLASYVKHVQL